MRFLGVAAAALFLLMPELAAAQDAREVEAVRGRVSIYSLAYPGYTVVQELKVWNLAPGSGADVSCEEPDGCPLREGSQTAGAAGFIDLSSRVRGRRLRPGFKFLVRVLGPNDRFRFKQVNYTIRRGRLPSSTRNCAFGDPLTFARDCTIQCPDGDTRPECASAGDEVVAAPAGLLYTGSSRRGVRFQRLYVDPVPAGGTVAVACIARSGCPFGLRVVHSPNGGRVNLARLLPGRPLPSGATLEVRVVKEQAVGRVHRYRVRSSGVLYRRLCLYPAEAEARACP